MMVPRAYSAASFGAGATTDFGEKENYGRQTRPKENPRRKKSSLLSVNPPPTRPTSSPESKPLPLPSPNRLSSHRPPLQPARPLPSPIQINDTSIYPQSHSSLRRRESAQDILTATAIPIRKKPRQRARQRLPDGDHVSDFSRLLLDDVKSTDRASLSSSLANPQFDGLFGNIDELVEGEMIVGSGGLDSGILTTRSISTESMVSLASHDDYSSVENTSPFPSGSRWNSDRKLPQLAVSESCEEEHPLAEKNDITSNPSSSLSLGAYVAPSPPQRKLTPREQRKASTFKSSLTASLKAIKSAAQSMSNYATTPSLQPDEFLSHSIFDIQPSMTDDRRPPPSDGPPSPALRRYLNPDYSHHPDSPAQLHFWLDHRSPPDSTTSKSKPTDSTTPFKPKIKKKYLKDSLPTDPSSSSLSSRNRPRVVPLATCIPPAVRTAHASSPPIWLAPDGTPSNKRTAIHAGGETSSSEAGAAFNGLKQREPRENRDFLRVFVAEMEMRRHGKLDDGAEGRAKMWLPPIEEKGGRRGEADTTAGKNGSGKGSLGVAVGVGVGDLMDKVENRASERWKAWTPEDVVVV